MKTKYFILVVVCFTSFNSLFANMDENINSSVRKSFQQEFTNAQDIQWTVVGSLSKATFNFKGQEWYAFYSAAGERVALARNIHVSFLPFNLTNEVSKSYKDFWITSAFEVSDDNGSNYFVTIESADQRITLKSLGSTQWTIVRSTDK
jgi:hypothetical protein